MWRASPGLTQALEPRAQECLVSHTHVPCPPHVGGDQGTVLPQSMQCGRGVGVGGGVEP